MRRKKLNPFQKVPTKSLNPEELQVYRQFSWDNECINFDVSSVCLGCCQNVEDFVAQLGLHAQFQFNTPPPITALYTALAFICPQLVLLLIQSWFWLMRLSNFDTLYKILSGEVEIRVNKGNLKKLIKRATTWLFQLPKKVLQRGRKSRPKVE